MPIPGEVLDELLAEPFANWHVETTTHTHQLRVTKKGQALLHSSERTEQAVPDRGHDQTKERLLPEDHPVLVALGISDRQGRVKPSRQAKYRQVEEFLRALSAAIDDARRSRKLRTPTDEDPLRVVDLGCGNAYLTFAAHAWLREQLPVGWSGSTSRSSRDGTTPRLAEELGRRRRADLRRRRHPGRGAGASRRTSYSPCTPVTPPPTTRCCERSTGRRTWSSRPRAVITISPHSYVEVRLRWATPV